MGQWNCCHLPLCWGVAGPVFGLRASFGGHFWDESKRGFGIDTGLANLCDLQEVEIQQRVRRKKT